MQAHLLTLQIAERRYASAIYRHSGIIFEPLHHIVCVRHYNGLLALYVRDMKFPLTIEADKSYTATITVRKSANDNGWL
jgi:hypothetical protein